MYRVRHERYNAGLIASAIYNVNRSKETKPVYPHDFVPGMSLPSDPEEEQREAAKRGVALAIARVPNSITSQEFETLKQNMIERLNKQGLDGAAILSEVLHE